MRLAWCPGHALAKLFELLLSVLLRHNLYSYRCATMLLTQTADVQIVLGELYINFVFSCWEANALFGRFFPVDAAQTPYWSMDA